MTEYGCDVSHYQTLTNPAAVRGNGISFAWAKATEGTYSHDAMFSSHTRRLAASGVRVGAYHFARPGSASAQAAEFHATAGDTMQPGNLFPVLDMEDDTIPSVDAFICQFYDALNVGCLVVYGNLSWWTTKLHPGAWGSRNIVGWIARYNGDPGNPGWSYPKMVAHQHTDTGNVPGFTGAVDRDCTMPGKTLADFTIGSTAPKEGFLMALSDAQQATLYNQVMRLVPGDGAPKAPALPHPAGDAYIADLDFRNRVEAKLVALQASVNALTGNSSVTAAEMTKIVNDAVAQHVQISGTVTITGKAS